jgi:hypothetical protein
VASGDGVTSASDATVSTSSGAALGTYKVNVESLPKASVGVGYSTIFPKVAAAEALTLKDYGVTEGQVTVNGKSYTISDADTKLTVRKFFFEAPIHALTAELTPTLLTGGTFGHGALKLQGSPISSPISIGGPGDTSNFVSALGLRYVSASSAYVQTIPQSVLAKVALGDLEGGMSEDSDTLTINGKSVGTISKTATLGSVVAQINSTSGTGVTATIDPSSGRIRLTANTNGEYPITVSGDLVPYGVRAASPR